MSVLMFSSCNGSQSKTEEPVLKGSAAVDSTKTVAINVKHAIATDRQAVYQKFGKDYHWYETDILLP